VQWICHSYQLSRTHVHSNSKSKTALESLVYQCAFDSEARRKTVPRYEASFGSGALVCGVRMLHISTKSANRSANLASFGNARSDTQQTTGSRPLAAGCQLKRSGRRASGNRKNRCKIVDFSRLVKPRWSNFCFCCNWVTLAHGQTCLRPVSRATHEFGAISSSTPKKLVCSSNIQQSGCCIMGSASKTTYSKPSKARSGDLPHDLLDDFADPSDPHHDADHEEALATVAVTMVPGAIIPART
jgi:hypothetical protein